MHHAVAHSVDLGSGLDDAVLSIQQCIQNSLDGLCMGRHGNFKFALVILAGDLVGQAAIDADALAQALCKHLIGVRVHQLILQRGRSRVDD